METQSNQNTLPQPNTEQTLNTTFLEQRVPLHESALVPGVIQASPDAKPHSMADVNTMATTSLFTKPILVSQVTWSVDSAVNDNLITINLPDVLRSVDSPALGLLSIHAMYKSGFKFRIQVNSSPFHSGRLIAYFNPYNLSQPNSIYSETGLPHVLIDAANATVGHLEIPFLTLKDYFTTYQSDSDCRIGSMYLNVFNPLRIGTGGPTTVGVTIWLEPVSIELGVPVARHDVDLQMESVLAAVPGSIFNVLSPLLRNGIDKLFSATLGRSKQGKGEGQDHPEIPAPQNLGLQYSVPNICNGVGLNPSDKLALVPLTTEVDPIESSLHTGGDEMDLKVVMKVPMMFNSLEWSDDLTSGTILHQFPILPTLSYATLNGQVDTLVSPTFLAYSSIPFQFWRGSIKLRFEIAATQHHTGRLLIAYVPNDNYVNGTGGAQLGQTPTLSQLSQFPCEIFDLSLNKEFNFTVPYNSPTRFKLIDNLYNSPIPTVTYPYNGPQDYSLGTLYMAIQNPLSRPSTVSNIVNVNCYVSAGDDYEVRALKPVAFSVGPEIDFQMGVDLESSRSGQTARTDNVIGVDDTSVVTDTTQGNDSEMHLKNLLSRYYPSFAYRNPLTTDNSYIVSTYPTPTSSWGTTARPSGSPDLLNYFSLMYRFWFGGINWMFVHDTTVNTPLYLSVSHEPDTTGPIITTTDANIPVTYPYTTTTVNPVIFNELYYYSNFSNLRVNPTVCVTTPYRSLYTKLLCDASVTNTSGLQDGARAFTAGRLVLTYSNTTSSTQDLSCLVLKGAADDFRLSYLVCPPTAQSSSNFPA